MTAFIDIFLSFVFGAAIALACRIQLRVSPRPWYATRYFYSLLVFQGMAVLPSAAYRYFFHPDWSAMYLFNASEVQSLFGLSSLALIFASGMGAFILGNFCARTQREWILLAGLAVAIAGIATVAVLGEDRFKVVGNFAQWTGSFGLRQFAETDLLPAVLLMGGCVVFAWLHILFLFAREGAAVRQASR